MVAGGLTALVVVLAIVLFTNLTGNDETTTSELTSSTPTTTEVLDDNALGGGSDAAQEAPEGAAAGEELTGPWMRASLDGKDFVLSGVVPSAELAGEMLAAVEVAYSPYLRSDLQVDESIGTASWLEAAPRAVVLIPSITEGSIVIHNDQVEIAGTAPDQASVDRLRGALESITGLPVSVGAMEITGLAPPSFVMSATGGRIVLSGSLPSEEIRGLLYDGALAAYGSEAVEDQMIVDAGVYHSLWMYNGGPLLQALSVFPDYDMRIDGTAFSGFLSSGFTFESGSPEFSPEFAQVLDVGVSVLARDQSLSLTIEGHSDGSGPGDLNMTLSQQRAEAVLAYFVTSGTDPERLNAIGVGETEPIAPNDTQEGRARNRRIELVLSSAS